jgi:predicted naringenin-chalcone synthase
MAAAYINRIATAVPRADVHEAFIAFAESQLGERRRELLLFRRMVAKGGIDHRYSYVVPTGNPDGEVLDAAGLFQRGRFPDTGVRMRFFEEHAPALAAEAVSRLLPDGDRAGVTHLLITCCTGLASPGLDLELIERCGLDGSVERSILGFMGCYAAINALKLARHIVRSEPQARVLIASLELCTVHLQETKSLQELLSFLLWGDGAAACLVSAEPHGLALDSFHAVLAEGTRELITWNIRDSGFEMLLSGQVPTAIYESLARHAARILDGASPGSIDLWAVHPGGRTVLDAVEKAFALPPEALAASRETLRRFGNMSSATVLFVLESLMRSARPGAAGCAMSFGPGLVAETMLFHAVG